jgi:hypothetical protein
MKDAGEDFAPDFSFDVGDDAPQPAWEFGGEAGPQISLILRSLGPSAGLGMQQEPAPAAAAAAAAPAAATACGSERTAP